MKVIGLIDAVARYDKRTIIVHEGEEIDVTDAIGKSLVAQKLATPVQTKVTAKPPAKRRTTRKKTDDADA